MPVFVCEGEIGVGDCWKGEGWEIMSGRGNWEGRSLGRVGLWGIWGKDLEEIGGRWCCVFCFGGTNEG